MRITRLLTLSLLLSTPVLAQDDGAHRELDAHVHGHGTFNMVIDGDQIAMELEAPGMDIVGFEHAATSDADKQAVADAIEALSDPLTVFGFNAAAECSVTSADVHVILDEHGHEDEHDEDHEHEDEDHEHEDEDHDHEHDEDHEHESGGHSEFHAEYALSCAHIDALDTLSFAYFEAFPGAQELDLQIVSEHGADATEVTRDNPVLDLSGLAH